MGLSKTLDTSVGNTRWLGWITGLGSLDVDRLSEPQKCWQSERVTNADIEMKIDVAFYMI